MFGPVAGWPSQDLVALSYEFDAGLVAEAYRAGVFPMPLHESDWPEGLMGWWSPMRRGILPLAGLWRTRSLDKSVRRYRVTADTAFDRVIAACADPRRPGGWIDPAVIDVYTELHRDGVAHSVEVWTRSGALSGVLYGVSVGGLFAGESMFHEPDIGRDASKVALVALVDFLNDGSQRLLDVQWRTPHLASLGAVEVRRPRYLALLARALDLPEPHWGSFADKGERDA